MGRWKDFIEAVNGRPVVRAQAEGVVVPAGGVAGSGLSPFTFPAVGLSKNVILSVPSLQRAHDLIVSLVAGLPIVWFHLRWDEEAKEQVEERHPPLPWHNAPDPAKTRSQFLGGLASDLWCYGKAYARVTSRYVEGDFPASFTFMPKEAVNITYPPGALPELGIVPGCRIEYQGAEVAFRDVVEFISPLTGVTETAWRSVITAIALDEAAHRFSAVEMPSGWLEQVDGEPMSGDELVELAAQWGVARRENATGALNQFVKFRESTFDPDRLQLVESRQYQSLEMARIGNVPPYLIGAPAGTGMTYQNAQTARADLVDFGASPIIDCINQTLSKDSITPRGNLVRLNINAWLANPYVIEQPVMRKDQQDPNQQDDEQRKEDREQRREDRKDRGNVGGRPTSGGNGR